MHRRPVIRPGHAFAALWVCLLALAVGGPSASAADFGLASFATTWTNADGTPVAQAGAHPYAFTTSFSINTREENGSFHPIGSPRDITVSLPPGLMGNPFAVGACAPKDLGSDLGGQGCPNSTQVGTAEVVMDLTGFELAQKLPLFNMQTEPGHPAQFAFNLLGQVVHLNAAVRSGGDYGLDTRLADISQGLALMRSTVTLWGVPADPSHDDERSCPGTGNPCKTGLSRRPFLTMPTSCSAPLTTAATATTWQTPGLTSTRTSAGAVPISGCHRLPFTPKLDVTPTTTDAGAPAGLAVQLAVPQNDNPDGLAAAHLRKAVVTLPEGVTVNTSSGAGLVGCAPAQVDLGSDRPASCPDAAKIGTVEVVSPLVDHPLRGGIYLAQQQNNPYNNLLAMYIAISDPDTGIVIKLPGRIDTDPATGQVTTTIDDAPRLPFDTFTLSFRAGSRAVLAAPRTCGTYTTHATFTSWATDTPVSVDSPMVVRDGCDRGARFEPALAAGVVVPAAGAASAFSLTVARPDGEQDLSGLDVTLPAGLLGRVGDVPLCPDAQAAAGTCGAASQVGHVTVATGAGTDPLYVPQPGRTPTAVYLAGPYKGAPFSLSLVVPAQAGPLDLGTVVVRAALFIDPTDAHVTVKSDPIPTMLQGIPLRLQKLNVTLDRAGFMVNPTSCAPKQVAAHVTSAAGAAVDLANRFQVGGCGDLGYAPKLTIGLSGKGETKDGKHPTLTARLTTRAADANSRRVRVVLPLALALEATNAEGLCEPVDAAARRCPATSIVGTARARSILAHDLTTPVYFVRGERVLPGGRVRTTLPKLFIPLAADGVTVDVWAGSEVQNDRLVTTFDGLPDAPFSVFDLTIAGGRHGILAVSSGDGICTRNQVADATFTAQSGKPASAKVTLGSPCGFGVVKTAQGSKALSVTVGGIGAGRLSASGHGVATARRTIAGATAATLALPLTRATRTALARGRAVRVKLTVAFTPKGGKAKKVVKTIVLRGAAAKR
ncbi:MAG TPA: hypothetical protein VFG42_22350 [Baekduia sp.]|uniref:hypothetical protein n=1 Tax=Baekduia sp. TaxID=2600305 RepID=UPI002D7809ED|nr:hypothetical protein [Baekduia sp.]HET6509557.1 hypothetical protein [Baekduia sp.]